MSIAMLNETRAAIGCDAGKCESRSLFLDRFADPSAKDTKEATPRKDWFTKLVGKQAAAIVRSEWHPPGCIRVHARLMGRLMVNMAEGVMENANLHLDRFGIPTIPGSAVKGCVRRIALQALHDWVAAGTDRPAADDACAACCEGFATPAQMLAAIARVFGWVENDWISGKKEERYLSDFAWACGEKHEAIWTSACVQLAQDFGWNLPETRPLKKLPSYAGSIAFLSAYPNRDPGLEMDVLTPHHTLYHSPEPDKRKSPDKWHAWNECRLAPDTEDPVPVFFPAVKPQSENDYFTFPLIPLNRARPEDLSTARRWLSQGLELIGLGAKTNSGYGWFDSSERFQQIIQESIEKLKKQRRENDEKKAREAQEAAYRDKVRLAKAALESELAGLPPQEREDRKIELLSEQQFAGKVQAFCKDPKKGGPSDAEKQAIVRALRGPRLAYWQSFKVKATKGDLATVDLAIRALSKTMNLGKMP